MRLLLLPLAALFLSVCAVVARDPFPPDGNHKAAARF